MSVARLIQVALAPQAVAKVDEDLLRSLKLHKQSRLRTRVPAGGGKPGDHVALPCDMVLSGSDLRLGCRQAFPEAVLHALTCRRPIGQSARMFSSFARRA